MLDNKSILITGGTGSFGQNFIKYVLKHYKPSRLIVYSRDELKQFEMQSVYPDTKYPCMRYFLGDVRDLDRLMQAFRGVHYVIHAAALKHVPAAEYNPLECVKTNIIGAENVVTAAIERGVGKVIALSTDKACSPLNLYGATKLASDKIFVAGNHLVGTLPTRFSVVRYGNVVGSRGSVIPFFRKLVAEGVSELPVTDERMTRFWITVEEAVQFVMDSFTMMSGGEIFVPKIPSMKVVDLVRAITDKPYRVIGIRPGEKLHEEMINPDDSPYVYDYKNRYIVMPAFPNYKPILPEGAALVPDRFRYSSDVNDDWLNIDQIKQMISRC